nr:hypothetical protein [uncultured Janthinobacterium sp.]
MKKYLVSLLLVALTVCHPAYAGSNSGIVATLFKQSGAGAVPVSQAVKLQEHCSVFDFMKPEQIADAKSGAATIDATAAVQAAIDGCVTVYANPGKYRITSQLVTRGVNVRLYGAGELATTFDKRFSGEVILMKNGGAELSSFGIIGNSASYTGGGIKATGNSSTIKKIRIQDTYDSGIITAAGAAVYLTVEDAFLLAADTSNTFGIRQIGDDSSASPTARTFSRISGGGALVDFSGMNAARLVNSFGSNIKFSATTGKIYLAGNRFTVGAGIGNITIKGVDHYIDANAWGFSTAGQSLVIDAAASNVFFSPSNSISINGNFMSSVTDNAPIGGANNNNLTTQLKAYPFGWFGSTTAPAIGNGTSYSYYKQEGRMAFVSFGLMTGSTTSVGAGTWTFQLPYKALITKVGTALVKASGGTYYNVIVEVQGGSSVAYLYLDGGTGALGSASLSFGAGALIEASIDYLIATQ